MNQLYRGITGGAESVVDISAKYDQPNDIGETCSKIDQICDQAHSFKQSAVIKLSGQHHKYGNKRQCCKRQIE